MKKVLIALTLFVSVFSGNAQFALDAGIGSQSARTYYNGVLQIFSTSFSVRFQAPRVFLKLCTKLSIPRSFNIAGYTRTLNVNGYYDSNPAITGSVYNEKSFGVGVGFNYYKTKSKARPYLMMEFYQTSRIFKVDESPSNVMAVFDPGTSWRNDNTISGKNIKMDVEQFRLGAGIQIDLKKNFTFFNEASLNMDVEGRLYGFSMGVELGIRYYLW